MTFLKRLWTTCGKHFKFRYKGGDMGIARVRTELVIDVSDWDQLVTETYGRPYNFQQQDGCKGRGREHITIGYDPEYVYDFERTTVPEIVNHDEMGVSFEAWLARDPEQKLNSPDDWDRDHGLELWWHRNFYPTAESIGHDLLKRSLIEEGDYTIDIDW